MEKGGAAGEGQIPMRARHAREIITIHVNRAGAAARTQPGVLAGIAGHEAEINLENG